MIFKEIDNIRDVGVICHYFQSSFGWFYPLKETIDNTDVRPSVKSQSDKSQSEKGGFGKGGQEIFSGQKLAGDRPVLHDRL